MGLFEFYYFTAAQRLKMLQLLLIVTVGVVILGGKADDAVFPGGNPNREFMVIAHMVNNENIARWALRSGVNALEIDVQFDPKTGEVTDVHHGLPCDCTCYLNMFGGSVCDFDGVCTGHTPHQRVFSTIMEDPHLLNIAMIYIDSKTGPLSKRVQARAGEKVVEMLERELFSKGYRGKVLIGVGSNTYLLKVADRASRSAYTSLIYITYDMFDETLQALRTMVKLPYPNKIFSIGLTACSPTQYYWDTTIAAVNKAKGLLSDVVAWTVDSESSWEEYYIAGARGMITNFIHNMLDWVARKGLHLTRPTLETATEFAPPRWDWPDARREIVTKLGTCDCGYSAGGCSIYKKAPAYSACRCVYDGAWQCSGQVVACDQSDHPLCTNPDKSILSCVQGGGDCGGYINTNLTCDCEYRLGGCTVYDPAPPGYACKCSYDEFWMCSGTITGCRDPHSEHCSTPDTSIFSCLQGKGDCGGYTDYTCECSYGSGGCTITKPAPPGTACQCAYEGAWTCSGTIVTCKNDDAEDCIKPSTSIGSCVQGGGECGAYTDKCKCNTKNDGGCVIVKPAPSNTACSCYYHGFPYYYCTGYVAACGVYHADTCSNPDTSVDSCLQGGGNCAGYTEHVDIF